MGNPTAALAIAGQRLSVAQRLTIVRMFFTRYPGAIKFFGDTYGYGEAVLDFIQWEHLSHRVVDRGGSPWWKAVNGCFALDVLQAQRNLASGTRAQSKAITLWMDYALASNRGKATQAMFWQAHQTSIHEGIALSGPPPSGPFSAEARFADAAIKLLDLVALSNKSSNTHLVGDLVFAAYPQHYPATEGDVNVVTAIRKEAQVLGSLPDVSENIGLISNRWPWTTP